jgi:glycosyltransferase involved in cell wall biosynthesis
MTADRPWRLLIVTESLGGGLGAAVRAEVKHFGAAGWEVLVAAPTWAHREARDLADVLHAVEIPSTIRNVRGDRRAGKELRSILHESAPDIVHCHGIRSFLVTRALANIQASVTWHGSRALPDEPGVARLLRRPAYRVTAALAQEAIAAGPDLGAAWSFLPHASPRLRSLEQVAPTTEVGPARYAFVGRLAGQKRVEMFIEALALAAQRCHVEGIVIGAGPRSDEIRELAERLDAPVELLGQRDDVGSLIASSRALVLTTWFEAVAFAAQEAMWVGRPVLASPVPALRWLVGDTGRFVEDANELADVLVELSDPGLAAELGERAARRVRSLIEVDSPWPELERRFRARVAP